MHAGEIHHQFSSPHHEGPSPQRESNEFSPPPAASQQRKRTFSNISGEFSSPYQPQRPSAHYTPYTQSGSYSPNGLAPHPTWKGAPDTDRRLSGSLEAMAAEPPSSEFVLEWNDALADGYGVFNIFMLD